MADQPPAPASEVVTLLRSIDASLKILVGTANARRPKEVATAGDLDGQYGDPKITFKDPRDWKGPTMNGRHFSECPAEYLDLLAERFDYFAEQEEREGKTTQRGQPTAPYRRKDAARARGWAARIRNGYTAPSRPAGEELDATAWAEGGADDTLEI